MLIIVVIEGKIYIIKCDNNGDILAATIGANGLSVVHQGSGGEASADSPDVCATTTGKSTSNIAYGNSAKSSDLADGSTTVTMDGGNSVALKGSIFSKSTGDEGGDKKGVASGTIQGEAAFISASPTVKIEGQGVARQSDSMTMNSGNTLCSGVQNPPIQIGTPEPETYSVNIYCENLANAPFKVKDGDGNIVASGELDGRGKCTLDPLPEDMRLEVEYDESPNEFNWGPGPVDFNQRYGELSDDAFFSLAAGSQYPFWLRKPNSRAEQYQWGILGCQTYPNETLQSIIELEAKYLSPQLFTYWDAQEFATSLLKVMDKEPMEQKDVRYFVSQLLCIASPNISTSVYADAIYSFIWLDPSTSYGELWANLRYFGRGNPQKAWDSLDWSAAAQHINKVADAFFERFLSRLEYVKGNASLTGYSEVEKVTLGHIDTVKRVRKQLIDETQTLLDNTKAKIQGIIDKGGDKPPVVKRPNQIVANAYDLNDKLYIQAPKLDKPKMELAFDLGWMQCDKTQSQDELWDGLFTTATTEEHKQLIKRCNRHLNEPVREGEIVIFPTMEPKTEEEKSRFNELLEEAKIASLELGKLLDEEVATLHRHFDLFSHQLWERIKSDGLPTDYYAQVSTGVGATSALVEQNLKNINGVLIEINDLYASQVAMASRTGGINYGSFVAERSELFKKLDGFFAVLSKRSVQLPIYNQIKRNLKLSTKSVIHNADEILKTGYVKELGKRIGNIAIGISASRGLGYVGILIGANSAMNNIYEACKVDGSGDCGKTTTREALGFVGSIVVGGEFASIGAAGAVATVSSVALLISVTVSAPVLAITAIGGAVIGGAIGGIGGSTGGKWVGDVMYEWAVDATNSLEELF